MARFESEILSNKSKYSLPVTLKFRQIAIIRHLINKKDVFVLLSTGFGKSLMYMLGLVPLLLDDTMLQAVSAVQSLFDVPNLMTATATKEIQRDMDYVLWLHSRTTVVSDLPERPNIFIDLKERNERYENELNGY